MKKTPFKKKIGKPIKRTQLKAKKGFKEFGGKTLRAQKMLNKKVWDSYKPKTPQQILDGIVSKTIRLVSADYKGYVACATCGVIKHWTEMQCGHFQKRQHLATRYDPYNLAVQCEDCNCFKDGENEKMAQHLDRTWGIGTAEAMRVKARTIISEFNYEAEIEKWEKAFKKIVATLNSNIQF